MNVHEINMRIYETFQTSVIIKLIPRECVHIDFIDLSFISAINYKPPLVGMPINDFTIFAQNECNYQNANCINGWAEL